MLKYLVAVIVVAATWIAWAFLREVVPLWVPIVVTVVAGLVLLTIWLVARFRAAQAARSLEKALAQQASQQAASARPDLRPKVEELQETFEKAVSALKESKLGRGRRGSDALYVLPWYLIIGPSGAGKTEAIKKSGLRFPHVSKLDAEQPELRGLGGTRNCDWWLTSQAILLDTTGRWVEGEEDREEWRGFLGLLKKFRKKKPLNGLIIGISVNQLAGASSAELTSVAQNVRKRIDDAMTDLDMVLPVYVLFLKSDLISGFVETFGDLTKDERTVVLGFTEEPDEDTNPADRFEKHFGHMIGSLESFSLRRLKEVNRLEVRHKIFGFPQQLEELKPSFVDFIKQVFEENVFSASPMMRGAYLVSATQEGRPFDLVLEKISDGYGLPLSSEAELNETKGYFLEKLFREVIFGDKDLAVRSVAERKRQRRIYYASVASVLTLAGLLLTVPAVSCVANRSMANRIEEAGEDLARQAQQNPGRLDSPISYLPFAKEIQTLYVDETEGAPFRMRAGLYKGDDLVGPASWFYGKVLEKNVIDQALDAATASLKEFGDTYARSDAIPSKAEYIRSLDQLRLHLLLTGPKEQNEPPLEDEVADSLAVAIATRWDRMRGLPPDSVAGKDTTQAARAYVMALAISEGKLDFDRNDDVVDKARKALSRVSGMDIAIDSLVRRYQRATPEITVRRVVGPGAASVAGRRAVRAAFTKQVWDEHIRELLSGDAKDLIDSMWVLGRYATLGGADAPDSDEEYVRELRSRYLERYIDEWREFIRGIWIRPSPDTQQALSLLRQLTSGNPPPLPRVFSAVATNVNLAQQQGAWWPFPLQGCGEGDSALTTECDVLKAFEGFLRFGVAEPAEEGAEPPPTALQNYQEKLLYLRDAFVTALNDPSSETLAQEAAVALAETQGLIDIQEVGWRPSLVTLLLPPIESVIEGHWMRLAKDRGRAWCHSVKAPFDETLAGRYPLSRTMDDVSLADFIAFYAPVSGSLWRFQTDLLVYAIPHHGATFQTHGKPGTPYSPGLSRFLNRSWRIASSLFPTGAEATPRVNLQARIRPSPDVSVQTLSIGGQVIDYYNGPETWTPISWPGELPEIGAKIEIRGGGSLVQEIEQQGAWGFFRLLEGGRVRRHGANSFTAVWRVGPDIRVEIDFRVIGQNPFFGTSNGRVLDLFRGADARAPRNIVRETSLCGG